MTAIAAIEFILLGARPPERGEFDVARGLPVGARLSVVLDESALARFHLS